MVMGTGTLVHSLGSMNLSLLKLCGVALAKTIGNVQNPRCILSDIGEISGSDSVNKSISHFFVREVEKICVVFYIAVLDCEIAALVNHWQWLLHVSLVVDKLRGIIVFAHEFVDVFVAVGEQAHKICRRARGKPEVP